jgi:hypothetical protein
VDSSTQRELHALLGALLDGTLTAEQQDRLGPLLAQDAAARDLYLAYCELHADLALRGGAGDLSRLRVEQTSPERRAAGLMPAGINPARRTRWLAGGLVGLGALVAAVLLVLTLWRRPSPGLDSGNEVGEPVDDTVAVLLQSPEAEWAGAGPHARAGAALSPGWLRLRSGYAHIEFYSGATVLLEAPADLKLISRTEAYCERGKLRATVPAHAHGFQIATPKLKLVDRGTEFGLQVGEQAATEVHVFQGKVEVHDARTRRDLATGQGVRLDGAGDAVLIPSAPAAFRTADWVAARSRQATRRRHDAWLAAAKVLRRDPSLLVHYPFEAEPADTRTLRNQAGRPAHDATIVGCSWATGRWPGKHALEFKRVSDRVRLHVGGTFESLTLLAWARVDALANVMNSLFMTDGWDVGGLHWQIGKQGKLVLGVRSPSGRPHGHYHAHHVLGAERLGQWLHLAVVYDLERGRVTHYVDGRPAGSSRVVCDVPLRLGNVEIGNWNMASYRNRQPIRSFSGCVDEFLLFSRALDDDEVERLHSQGRPPS